jgi:hypothetical protein
MSTPTRVESSALPLNVILRALLRRTRTAVEAYARHRAEGAASPAQFQQAKNEMRRYRRLMRSAK